MFKKYYIFALNITCMVELHCHKILYRTYLIRSEVRHFEQLSQNVHDADSNSYIWTCIKGSSSEAQGLGPFPEKRLSFRKTEEISSTNSNSLKLTKMSFFSGGWKAHNLPHNSLVVTVKNERSSKSYYCLEF